MENYKFLLKVSVFLFHCYWALLIISFQSPIVYSIYVLWPFSYLFILVFFFLFKPKSKQNYFLLTCCYLCYICVRNLNLFTKKQKHSCCYCYSTSKNIFSYIVKDFCSFVGLFVRRLTILLYKKLLNSSNRIWML